MDSSIACGKSTRQQSASNSCATNRPAALSNTEFAFVQPTHAGPKPAECSVGRHTGPNPGDLGMGPEILPSVRRSTYKNKAERDLIVAHRLKQPL